MSRPRRLLLLGASGFTAGLILEAARRRGLSPIVSGRDPGRLRAIAAQYGLEARPASLEDPSGVRRILEGVDVVLNAAGPFVGTVEPVLRACLDARVHYLDVSGEVDALELAAGHHAAALHRGVMVLPGVGFDVVASDCLGIHVSRRLPGATTLRFAVSGLELLSPGSVRSIGAELGRATRVRRAGLLREIEPGTLTRHFDFGTGQRACVAVSWGDLTTAYYATGVPDIETYFELTPAVAATLQANQSFGWFYRLPWVRDGLARQLRLWRPTPSADERRTRRATLIAEAEDGSGRRVASRLTTPEAYTFTAESSVAVAERTLSGDVEPGFQTPGRLFGPGFVLAFAGVSRVDLEATH